MTNNTPHSELLQFYLMSATKKISRYEHRSQQLLGEVASPDPTEFRETELAEIARESEDVISPGERDALLSLLRIVGIRRGVSHKVSTYADQWRGASIRVQHMEVFMGDVFKNIQNSIIANRGSIAKGVVSLRQKGNEDIAKAVADLDRLIAEAEESILPLEKKAESTDLLNGLAQEMAKPQPNKTIVRSLGTSLLEALKYAAPIATAGKEAIEVIRSLL